MATTAGYNYMYMSQQLPNGQRPVFDMKKKKKKHTAKAQRAFAGASFVNVPDESTLPKPSFT